MVALLAMVLVLLTLSGCFDNSTTTLMDLPMPASITGSTVVGLQKVGSTESLFVVSPGVSVSYMNTGVGIESELLSLYNCGGIISAPMTKFAWRDQWLGGKITSAIDYDPDGKIVDARIILTVPEVSIIGMFANPRYTIDRSRLILQFLPDSTGVPVLTNAFYYEEWGLKNDVCFGITAAWYDLKNLSIFDRFHRWGFWETTQTPFELVVEALDTARKNLRKENTNYLAYDLDGFREVLGEQSGTDVETNGKSYCKIRYEYNRIFGAMPNTECLKGSLTKISWEFADGQYRSLVVRSSQLVNRPSSIFIFCRNKSEESVIEKESWLNLYGDVTKNCAAVIYAAGTIGTISSSTGKGDSVDIGEGGGIFYGFIHSIPKTETILELRKLLDMVGLPGIKALGFYYPTGEHSGNGVHYFLSIMAIRTANNMNRFEVNDIGLLDRVGLPVANPLNNETFDFCEGK